MEQTFSHIDEYGVLHGVTLKVIFNPNNNTIEKVTGWRARLRTNYNNDRESFIAFCGTFNIHDTLGFDAPEDAWTANPIIEGNTDPRNFRIVEPWRIPADQLETLFNLRYFPYRFQRKEYEPAVISSYNVSSQKPGEPPSARDSWRFPGFDTPEKAISFLREHNYEGFVEERAQTDRFNEAGTFVKITDVLIGDEPIELRSEPRLLDANPRFHRLDDLASAT